MEFRDDHNNTLLSQDSILKQFLTWEGWAKCTFQGQGKGGGATDCPSPAHGSAKGHVLSMTFFNTSVLLSTERERDRETEKERERECSQETC